VPEAETAAAAEGSRDRLWRTPCWLLSCLRPPLACRAPKGPRAPRLVPKVEALAAEAAGTGES